MITEVANATAEDIDIAVKVAKRTLFSDHWGYKSTGSQRAKILRNLQDVLIRRKDEIAVLDSYDMGKPLREALADLGDAITACEHFANLAEEQDKHQDEVVENGTGGDFVSKIRLEPIGVVAAITPWNYPFLMGIWKVIPAIAAGCTIVLKPSELAPLSCLLFGELVNEAGLPPGALNIVSGLGPSAGAPLAAHDEVDKVSFTGSVPTAQKIMAAAALGPRAISLELGGKSPLVVFDDVSDVNAVVDWILTGILWGSGQVCSATSRVLLQNGIRDRVMDRLKERLAILKIGPSLHPDQKDHEGPTMGPVVSKGQYDKILAYIQQGKEEGLHCVWGGDDAQLKLKDQFGEGYFIPPTVFVDVPVSSKLWREEIFGPVLCIRVSGTQLALVSH